MFNYFAIKIMDFFSWLTEGESNQREWDSHEKGMRTSAINFKRKHFKLNLEISNMSYFEKTKIRIESAHDYARDKRSILNGVWMREYTEDAPDRFWFFGATRQAWSFYFAGEKIPLNDEESSELAIIFKNKLEEISKKKKAETLEKL